MLVAKQINQVSKCITLINVYQSFSLPVPEEVQNPSVHKINFTHVALDWDEPLVPNGIITDYEINVTVIDKVENQTRTKYPGYIIELSKYIK